jgi:hypothetical protein
MVKGQAGPKPSLHELTRHGSTRPDIIKTYWDIYYSVNKFSRCKLLNNYTELGSPTKIIKKSSAYNV